MGAWSCRQGAAKLKVGSETSVMPLAKARFPQTREREREKRERRKWKAKDGVSRSGKWLEKQFGGCPFYIAWSSLTIQRVRGC